MNTITLKKGPLKVITFAPPQAFADNEQRNRAAGKVLLPTVHVFIDNGDKPLTEVTGHEVAIKGASAVRTASTHPAPKRAAPRLADRSGDRVAAKAWIETTEAVEVINHNAE